MAVKITIKPPEKKKIGNLEIVKHVVHGGLQISKAAKKLLVKQQDRIEASIKPPPPVKSVLTPSDPSPDKSVLAALWVHPARLTRTLYLVRNKDGMRYKVLRYNPASRIIYLESVRYGTEFDATMDSKVEETYTPMWG